MGVFVKEKIQDVVARVWQMEQYLDEILEEIVVYSQDQQVPQELLGSEKKEELQQKLEALRNYYDSGLWLHDYECDERGELPKELKRGVLAQDTLYNLLMQQF